MKLPVGLIGVGRMGATFAEILAQEVPEAQLLAIADLDGDRARELAERHQVPHHFGDYAELLGLDEVRGVFIITPTVTHLEVVQAAAAAGKHVFVEKPLALTVPACDRAIESAAQAGVKLQVGLMKRFHPDYQAARRHIREGRIGLPTMFKSINRDPVRTSLEFARRESSGGLIMDMGTHDFDLARWLMGSEIRAVHSFGVRLAYPELEQAGDIDNAVVNLRFADGAVGSVDLTRNAVYGYDSRTEVLGTQGALAIGKLPPPAAQEGGVAVYDRDTEPVGRFRRAYQAEAEAFVRSVLQDQPPPVTGEHGRDATAVSVAATRSLDEGRAVMLSEVMEEA